MKQVRLRVRQLLDTHRQFRDVVRKERRLLILATLMLAGEILFQVLAPIPIKYIFDGILVPDANANLFGVPPGFADQHPGAFLAILCTSLILFALGGGWCGYYRQVWAATAGQRMVFKLRKRLYAHMQRLSLRFHRDSHLGDLLLRITGDIAMLRDALSSTIIDIIGRISMVVVMVGVLFVLDPLTAVVAIAVVLFVAILSGRSGKRIVKITKRQREKEGVLAHAAGETLSAVPLVKAYGAEERVVRAFARKNRASMRDSLKGTRLQALLARRVELVFAVSVAVVLGFGVIRVQDGALTAGSLLIFVSYVRSLNKPLRKLASMATKIGKAAACSERVLEIMNLEPEEVDQPGAIPAPHFEGSIRVEDVSFHYDEDRRVLSGMDLDIAAGETIALVGRNGAGKSTTLSLLLRFFEPDQGRILFDDVDIREYQIRSLREQISIALQSTLLFGTSIRENLLCAAPDATDEEIAVALELAGAGFVAELPEGIDTVIADNGENLSGGERRKVALAATVLRPSSILILDEPTAGIDHASRDEIVALLPAITRGRTCIVISHDQAMLDHVDRVVYLEAGSVRGVGTHQELMSGCPSYQDLFTPGTSTELLTR